jgi:hypothetical protein
MGNFTLRRLCSIAGASLIFAVQVRSQLAELGPFWICDPLATG